MGLDRFRRLAPIAAALALAGPAAAETHEIMQSGFAWVPDVTMAAPGDTIRWIHVNGTHTVTSGEDCTPGGDELIFDEPLTAANPVVEIIIPSDIEQTVIPYFCTPHCGFDMVGQIILETPPPKCPADIDLSGDVGFPDLLAVLSAWGPCGDPCDADLDSSGDVGFPDLLTVLSAWGPCP